MTVVMLALGSRGDVQPLSVLAGALVERGVPATVVAIAEYEDLARGRGVGFVPVAGRLADAMARGRSDDTLARTMLGQGILLRRWVAGMADAFADAAVATVRPGDTVLAGVLARGAAAALAEGGGARMASVVYTGQVPTLHRESHFSAGWFSGWAPYDRWGTGFNWRVATALGGPLTTAVRGRLGLPRRGSRAVVAAADRHPTLVAASPVLVPPAPDWPAGVHPTGWLAPPEDPWAPDGDLARFVAGGRAVHLGFGSLARFSTPAEFAMVVRAARLSGRPLVTVAPPGVPVGPVGDDVYALGAVPHHWLFPRLAGVIHHGGAGTTHAALRAGVPSAAIPFGVDQPYQGARLHALGVGPAPLPLRRVTPETLAALVTALVDGPASSGYRTRAAEVGEACRAEDGVGATIETMERLGLTKRPG